MSIAADSPLLEQAERALSESLPQVAIAKLQTFLAAPDLTPELRATASRKLAEALLRSRQLDDALATIQPLVNERDPVALALRADILGAAGRWAEALPIYRAVSAIPGAPLAARLGEAEAWYATGDPAKAIAVLDALVRAQPGQTSAQLRLASLCVENRQLERARAALAAAKPERPDDVKWKKYVEGRMLLLQEHPAPALALFEEILRDPRHLSENLLVGATIGIAEAHIAMNGYDAADRVLETFIWRNPDSSFLELVFQRLDDIYAHQDDPKESELQKWGLKQPARRAALARFYVARLQIREKKQEKAAVSLEVFVQSYPSHELLPQIHMMQAELFAQQRNFPEAVRALEAAARHARGDELRGEVELRTGLAHFQQGEFLLAANFFDNAARRSPRLRETALYDGALAALNQNNFDRFLELYRTLSAEFPESALRSQLILEEGLLQARTGNARASETLRLFLRHFPRHPRTAEAQLALAELAHAAGDAARASEFRTAANETAPSGEISDQTQFLAIFLADAQTPRRDEEVIKLALDFIRQRPKSPLVPEVRMKLGQVYFRGEDFANAETQFATLARENPDSPFAETALFLAGQSAIKSINPGAVDRALELFDQVAKREGPLKLFARQQQALVQSRIGKEAEAVTLYDLILGAQPPADRALHFAALAGKGDNLLALGRKDPAQLEAAIAVFDSLATLEDVPPLWRSQALYKKAKALEQLGRVSEALAAFYDVLDVAASDGREFLWFYKAGFEAARIFESQEQWKSAIGIYEKMARVEGPRAAEATQRAKQLRLEKFIWE